MQKLLEPNTVPPGGFRFLQAETRTWIEAPDYMEFFARVKAHRQANNIPLDQFWAEKVENQLCESLPPGLCKQSDPLGTSRNVFGRITWDQVYNGTTTLAAWAFKGFPKVDQDKAAGRGDICSRCHYNVSVQGTCAACGHLQNLAASFTGGRVTAADHYLKACAVCRCSLRVKVWATIEAIAAGTPETELPKYPDWCWIPKEIQEYRTNVPQRT
jgi:hypothetical protein